MLEKYRLYLFKEKNVKIKKIDIYNFFMQYQEIKTTQLNNNSMIKLTYEDPTIDCVAEIYLCEKLLIPNIYKLDSSYISLSSYIEIPLTTPDYSANIIFDMINKLTSKLTLALYNELFENIIPFRINVIKTSFNFFKKKFKEDNQSFYNSYFSMDKSKLEECLKYQRERYDIQTNFKEQGIVAPEYLFLQNNYRPYIACEWRESEATIFPPRLDIIYFVSLDGYKMYYAKDLLVALEKYLVNVPGYITTSMIPEKNLKKVRKAIKKAKLMPVDLDLTPIRLNEIIDF